MPLLSNDTSFCPADAQIWQKMTGFGPTWVQIISVCEFRLLQKYSKVIIDLLRMIIKPGIVFAQTFVIQTHHYLPKWHPKCVILEQKRAAVRIF